MSTFDTLADDYDAKFKEAVEKVREGNLLGAHAIIYAAVSSLYLWSHSRYTEMLKEIEENGGVRLEQVCGACPEAYDAFIGDELIGHLRLRHGGFSVVYIPTNVTVYGARPDGDDCFNTYERDFYLNGAKTALAVAHVKAKIDAMS